MGGFRTCIGMRRLVNRIMKNKPAKANFSLQRVLYDKSFHYNHRISTIMVLCILKATLTILKVFQKHWDVLGVGKPTFRLHSNSVLHLGYFKVLYRYLNVYVNKYMYTKLLINFYKVFFSCLQYVRCLYIAEYVYSLGCNACTKIVEFAKIL